MNSQQHTRYVEGDHCKEGGYFETSEDPQGVLEAFRDGRAEVFGINGNNAVVRALGITEFNHESRRGIRG